MNRFIVLFGLFILIIPMAYSAYPTIITVTGTLKNPSGTVLTGYSPRMKIYTSPPNVQQVQTPILDTATKYDNQVFSSVESGLVTLEEGTKYYLTMTFSAFCTQAGQSNSGGCASSTASPVCSYQTGGCWGFCKPTTDTNYQKNIWKATSGCRWTGQVYAGTCAQATDFSTGDCNGKRSDTVNPVGFAANSIGPAILGDDNVLIDFTLP